MLSKFNCAESATLEKSYRLVKLAHIHICHDGMLGDADRPEAVIAFPFISDQIVLCTENLIELSLSPRGSYYHPTIAKGAVSF